VQVLLQAEMQAYLFSWCFLQQEALPADYSSLWGTEVHSGWRCPVAYPEWGDGPSILRAKQQQQHC